MGVNTIFCGFIYLIFLLFLKIREIQLISVLLRIVQDGEKVKLQGRDRTNIVKYKRHLVKSKEKICACLQVGKAEMMFRNW